MEDIQYKIKLFDYGRIEIWLDVERYYKLSNRYSALIEEFTKQYPNVKYMWYKDSYITFETQEDMLLFKLLWKN
jgi:hypothetical protein